MRTKESFRLNIRVFNLIWPCDKRIYMLSLLDTHTLYFLLLSAGLSSFVIYTVCACAFNVMKDTEAKNGG